MTSANAITTKRHLVAITGILAATIGGPACTAADDATSITIQAGARNWPAGPMSGMPKSPLVPGKTYVLIDRALQTPAQTDAAGRLWWWSTGLDKGVVANCVVQPGAAEDRVVLRKQGDEVIEVLIDGKLFTALNFKKSEPKPYLYPVIGPTGDPVTRDFPMKDNPLEKDNGRQDHPHHRSIWCSHGDIRSKQSGKESTNYWHETKNPADQDREVVKRIVRTVSGPVFGEVEAEIEWVSSLGKREFTEFRTYRFWCGNDDSRMIDTRNVFKFDDGDVTFADTKEGGLMSLRLAVTMDEVGAKTPEKVTGQMTNSRGGVKAKGCWGQEAEWCDYVGPVDGKTVGVAVFDCPKNFRHPTRWHIRDYGLYTANPFGWSNFIGKDTDGSYTWKKGESVEFNYRVLIHNGGTKEARIADQWRLYSSPPAISVAK